jgi:hypothetical protein
VPVRLKTCTVCNARGAHMRCVCDGTALEPTQEVTAMLLQLRKAARACSSRFALDESVANTRARCGFGEQEGRDRLLLLAVQSADAGIVDLDFTACSRPASLMLAAKLPTLILRLQRCATLHVCLFMPKWLCAVARVAAAARNSPKQLRVDVHGSFPARRCARCGCCEYASRLRYTDARGTIAVHRCARCNEAQVCRPSR